MTRPIPVFSCLAALFILAPSLRGADATAIAMQQDLDERLKRLEATLRERDETILAMQQRFTALSGELERLRQEVIERQNTAVSADTLKRLAEQVQEVDRKRLEDNQLVLSKIAELGKAIASAPPPHRPSVAAPPSARPAAPTGPEEGFEHVVQSGDTLSAIVVAYREQGIKVTQKMVMDANPTVKWERLRVGQKLFIPKPK